MLNQLIASHNAVLGKVHVTGFVVNEGTGNGRDQLAVHSEFITTKVFACKSNSCGTDKCVALVVEVVHVAFDFKPLVLVVSQGVIVTSALDAVNHKSIPCAQNLTLLTLDLINTVAGQSEGTDGCVTGLVIEIVGVAVDDDKALLLEVGLIVSPADTIMIEAGKCEVGQIHTVFIEGAHHTVDEVRTGQLYAVHKIISFNAVDFEPAIGSRNAVNIGLTIGVYTVEQLAAAFTGQHVVNKHIVVAGCRNSSAPLNYGTASIVGVTFVSEVLNRTAGTTNTEHTTGIAGGGAGSSQILSLAGGMNMEAPLVLSVCVCVIAIHFGLNHSFICREGDGATIHVGHDASFSANDQTVVSGAVGIPHGVGGQDVVLILLGGIIGDVVLANTAVIKPALCSPNTDRQLSQDGGIGNLGASAGKGDHGVIVFVDVILGLETVSDFHAFQFPIIDIVKIDGGSHGINRCQIVGDQVEPVNGIGRQHLVRGGNLQTDCALFCIDDQLADDVADIALVVADLHNQSMDTVIQVQIGNSDGAVDSNCNVCIVQLTIDIQLDGVAVQTGGIGLGRILIGLCHQIDGVLCDGLTGNFVAFTIFIGNFHAGEVGILTIDGGIRIVNSDVINIIGDILIIVVIAFACGVMAVDLNIVQILISIQNFPAEVVPAAIVDTILRGQQRRQLVINTTTSEACRNLHGIDNHLRRQIHPEANTCGVGQIERLGQMNIHLAMARSSNIGPVDLDAHCVVAISDHAVLSISQIEICVDIIANGGITLLGIVSVRKITVLAGISNMPAVDILAVVFCVIATNVTGVGCIDRELAVFEVISDFRCLAKTDVGSNYRIRLSANDCSNSAIGQSGAFVTSSKRIANNRTQLLVRQGIYNVTRGIGYRVTTFIGGYVDRQYHSITIADNDRFLLERNFGNYDRDRSFTHHFVIINELYSDFAFFAVGCEDAIFDSTEGSVSQLPFCLCGNIYYGTCHVGTDHVKRNHRIGGIVLIFGSDMSLVELSVGGSSGNKADTGGGGAETTVRRRVVHL